MIYGRNHPPPTSAERRAERIEEAARLVLRWRDSVYPPHGGLASDLAFLALILDENDAPAAPKEEHADEHPAWMKCKHGVLLPMRCHACEDAPATGRE